MFFTALSPTDPMLALLSCSELYRPRLAEASTSTIASSLFCVLDHAERLSFDGDALASYFAYRLVCDENTFGRTAEMHTAPATSIAQIASASLAAVVDALRSVRSLIQNDASLGIFKHLFDYTPHGCTIAIPDGVMSDTAHLGRTLLEDDDPLSCLAAFYRRHGSGTFAIYRAFKWEDDAGLVPITDIDPVRLSSLLGYEHQKEALLSNTSRFVAGMRANNVLLFGDSGTGKSTSIRALLNEDDLILRGLRMIEVRKDRFKDIMRMIDAIRTRRYRFILFMDDLSFEEFETDYKYLKAIIEGGLERKPENTLVYATSNRRNIVREVWADRKTEHDDVHGGDTMQEKLSLADRFGLSIWYGPVGKSEYMEMVRALTAEAGICISDDELTARAMRWEIEKGSFTGRTARQFVQSLERDR